MTMTDSTLTTKQLAIVEAATRIYGEYGFRAGTVQLIAKEAGLSQAGLIHHFPTKQAILHAALAHRDVDDRELIRDAIETGSTVVEVFRRVLRWNAEHPARMRSFAMLSAEAVSADHPAHDYFQQRFARTAIATADIVRRNQADGLVRTDLSPETIADLVVAAAHGFRHAVLVGEELDNALGILDALERLLTITE